MTTADDAFDKLMNKNALNIPVANPSGNADALRRDAGGTSARAKPHTTSRTRTRVVRNQEPPSPVRVMNVVEPVEDYRPRGAEDDEKSDVFTTPTETDLDAVSEEDDAPRRPTQAIEAVPSPDEYPGGSGEPDDNPEDFSENEPVGAPGEEDAMIDDSEFREAEVVDESAAPTPASEPSSSPISSTGLALDRARRVRRFGYLPLAGIESFELRARDIMAGLVSRTPDMPSLAVVGSARGDGGTEVAIRLALAVAKRVDYRILLVDMDVRKPQVARRLGLSSKYFTATDVLRGGCALGEALMYSEEENLYVLPSRASDRDGDEVLDVKQVRQLMGRLHSAFDFVILCCGPMDHVDATILCRHAGATALAGFCRHTRASALRSAAERLAESGVTVAGLLLTGAA